MADTLLTAELDDTHLAPTFAELGVRPEIVRALADIGIERTFAIQELTLPLALAGEDLIGQARTGMGKTFGFGVPLLNRIATAGSGTKTLDGTPRALIIVPTRELCMQVTEDLENASKYLKDDQGTPVRVTAIYGGRPYDTQIAALRAGVDVVVGTPGRLLDLAQQNHLILGKVEVLVLDEADEMLDLGFLPDIERILNMVPEQRQTLLFSATMPGPIITLARTFLSRPTHIRAEEHHESAVHDRITQLIYRAHALDKSELVARILQAETRGATMIFARTKRTAQKVADDLAERGFAVGAVHGDLGQIAREKALKKFREGKIDVLVATDVAARGIDIDDVTHVVNYQCPEDEKTYVHRIGRTGRAGKTGVAVTLVDWDELNRWAMIDKALGLGIPEPAETYSRSPHLYEELGIPQGVTGTVRKGPAPRDEDAVVVERERRAPRERNRRRTRGGRPEGDAAPAATTTETIATEADSATGDPEKTGRRRRRRRRGKGGANGAEANGTVVATTSVETEAAAEPAGEAAAEGGRNRRRNRRGKGSENGTATDVAVTENATADVAGDQAVTGEAESNPASNGRKRTRRGKNSGDAADAVQTTAEAETEAPAAPVAADSGADVVVAEAPRQRTRRTKAAAEVVADSSAADAVVAEAPAEAPKKRVRRTKAVAESGTGAAGSAAGSDAAVVAETTAVESAAVQADSGEAAMSAPKKRASRAKAAVEAVAEESGAVAEAAPRKRTRKAPAETAAVAEASAAETVEAPKKAPAKRTRKVAAAAVDAQAESADNQAEPATNGTAKAAAAKAAPAKAKAGAKKATAATGEVVAEAEAPKKRVRKAVKAAAKSEVEAVESGAAASGSEAAPVKRTRRKKTEDGAEGAVTVADTAVAASA